VCEPAGEVEAGAEIRSHLGPLPSRYHTPPLPALHSLFSLPASLYFTSRRLVFFSVRAHSPPLSLIYNLEQTIRIFICLLCFLLFLKPLCPLTQVVSIQSAWCGRNGVISIPSCAADSLCCHNYPCAVNLIWGSTALGVVWERVCGGGGAGWGGCSLVTPLQRRTGVRYNLCAELHQPHKSASCLRSTHPISHT